MVPGVTSAVAGPAAAGIPVTHRGVASGFHVFTAHDRNDALADIDFAALVKAGGTCVFLMGLSLVGEIAARYGLSGVREGQQFAELNANTAGLLYQRIATLPNTTLYWGFSHRARGSMGIEKETMSMWIGSAEQIEQARQIYDRFANTKAGDANHLSAEEAMEQIAALAEELQFTNIVHTAKLNTDDKSAWDDIQGVFVVPSQRPVTEYAFASWNSVFWSSFRPV